MKSRLLARWSGSLAVAAVLISTSVSAAELRVMISAGFYGVYEELAPAFERASGRSIPFEQVGRRGGDVAECYADPTLAQEMLGWKATCSLDDMCRDAWRWQSMNPRGYRGDGARSTVCRAVLR